jgi:biotin synthase
MIRVLSKIEDVKMVNCCGPEPQAVLQKETENNDEALQAVSGKMRHDWSKSEIAAIYHSPLLELVYTSATVHRKYHDPRAVQQCTLLSVKTGGCSEDCSYCPQSAKHDTDVKADKMLDVDTVYRAAKLAKERGSTRFCMGAA